MEYAKEKNGGVYNIKRPSDTSKIKQERMYVKQHIFTCIGCGEELDDGCGITNQWHFKHKKDSKCTYSIWSQRHNHMSIFHRELQRDFFNKGADVEVKIGNNRADVLLNDRVIEIQYSKISLSEIESRNENYLKEKGKYPIWILDNEGDVDIDLFNENLLVINIDYWAIDMYFKRVKISFSTGAGLKKKDKNKKNNYNIVDLLKNMDHITNCFAEQYELDKQRIEKEKKEEKERLEKEIELEKNRKNIYEERYQQLLILNSQKMN